MELGLNGAEIRPVNPSQEHWYEYIYVEVENPSGNPKELNYYESNYNITNNYGIAINSSNSDVVVPSRSISLYTARGNVVDGEISGPLAFDYQAILGTLPQMTKKGKVSTEIYSHLQGTQGIFTDNMYIGNENEYIAYYTYTEDGQSKKKLSIVVSDLYINAGGGVSQNVSDAISEINDELAQQNSHLLIENDNVTLYSVHEVEQEEKINGITLTSAGIQFFTDNVVTNKDTWIDNVSLNSQEIYFERMYPRSFADKEDMKGEGNLVAMGRKNRHFTIKNIN